MKAVKHKGQWAVENSKGKIVAKGLDSRSAARAKIKEKMKALAKKEKAGNTKPMATKLENPPRANSVQVNIRFTPKEKKAIDKAASAAGVNTTTWVRFQCRKAAGLDNLS